MSRSLTSVPGGAALILSRLIPRADRDAIVGDLLEEAEFRDLTGARRSAWLAAECGTIALGLSVDRVRGWLVVPPVAELAAGLAVDGRSAMRGGHPLSAVVRATLFLGSVATLVFGAGVLVGSLLSAAGL